MKPEIEGKQRQLDINFKFLMDAIDNIHYALEPDKSGTWQMRAQMAVAATHKIIAEVKSLREKLAAAEKTIEEYVNFTYRSGEVAGEAMLKISALQEKLALSEAAGAETRSIIEEFVRGLNPFSRHEYAGEVAYEGKHNGATVEAANKALASDHGKAYLDVMEMRHRLQDKVGLYGAIWPCINTTDSDPRPHCVDIVNAVTAYLIGEQKALDRLPGRKGEEPT